MDDTTARRMLVALEALHGFIYFADEAHDAYTQAGLKGRRMGYFGSRAAAMGAVGPSVVVATFYNFHPDLVARAIPDAWTFASPSDIVAARFSAADAAMRRIFVDVGDPDIAEAADLARAASDACRPDGRPLYAGHADIAWPTPPHLVLWHAATLLREYRGDGHIAALVGAGIDGLEANVTFAATGVIGREFLQPSRQWSDDEWDAAVTRLADRGLMTPDGVLTAGGTALRADVEAATDAAAMAPWRALGADRCERLAGLGARLSARVAAAGAVPPITLSRITE